MQRTVRFLRIALPIAFFGFLLIVVFSWKRSHVPRDRSTSDPVRTTRPEKPKLESKGFEDTQTIGGRVVSRIRARRVVAYSSNWNTLEDVALTIYRANGLTYELTCPQAQFNSETKEADVAGGVHLTSSDGIVVNTAALHYDGNRLTNHIPVDFIVDVWHGHAGALDLDVAGETLRLFQNLAAATVPVKPDDVPMTLAAADSTFRRKEGLVEFTSNVVLTRLADRMASDHMIGRFTQDRKTLAGFEGTGHVQMSLSSNLTQGENLGGRKDITCDRFFSDVGPQGEITAFNAVGDQAPAHAVIEGPPKRDIVAQTIHIALVGRAVNEMKAFSPVVMKEFGEVLREIRSDVVTVQFEPTAHRASSALLVGHVHYTDPRNTAIAVQANYDIAGDHVLLTAEPGFDPTVTSDGNILKAKQIEFSPKAGTAKATGSVIAQLVSKPGGTSADSTSVFPVGKPVFVNSDVVTMRQANKIAVFSGNVRAWQDNNTVFAQEMQVQGAGDSITARGNVRATLYNTDSGGTERKTPVVSKSDMLVARKAERRIDLSGSVRIDDETRTMTSEKSSFFFDANRKIERIESETKVTLTDSATGRKATGDKAIYQVSKRMMYMFGKPATATDPSGTLAGEEITIDVARNKVNVGGPNSGTRGTYKPQP